MSHPDPTRDYGDEILNERRQRTKREDSVLRVIQDLLYEIPGRMTEQRNAELRKIEKKAFDKLMKLTRLT